MERKIVKFLEHWKDEPLRKPLVVYGSKQVGKTYTVLEFGEKNYNNVVYIDANDDVILSQNLKKEKTMDSVISYLSSYTQSQINKNDTLVVIDNVNSVNIVNAIKMVVLVELVWIFIQLLLYRLFGVDINQLIFVDLLHLVENASFIRSWIWYPSGLSWHSAVLAPLFVMGILFFDNPVIRILIVIESCVCGNRTTLLGVMCCLLLLLLKTMHMRKIKIEKEKVRLIIAILIAAATILIVTGIGPKILIKIFGNGKDASTLAHFGYYSDYFTIIKESSLYQIIFGYGVGCSGYTITSLYGRYADGGTWAIESDFINILVSRGIIGFIIYYWFLIRIMIKGFKIDYRYAIFIITVLFQGFGYNIQFDYLLLIEILMYILIENRVNFFDVVDELNAENSKIRREGKRFICRKFR